MNIRAVAHVISALVIIIGFFILSCVPVSWLMKDSMNVIVMLAINAIIPIVAGTISFYMTKARRGERYKFGVREGFGIVTFGWIAAAAFGCLPFIFISNFQWHDAFFETMSGFTTTGSSVIDNNLILMGGKMLTNGLDDIPRGLIYWRSLTHWLGGMGIVVLSLAILPFLKIGGQQLYNAEVPGFSSDQLTPRIANSAKILWGVYVLLTAAEAFLLWFGGMSLFDSLCTSYGTLATGGFSTLQSSIGGYDSVYFDSIITIFMFLAGCNFVLHFRALRGKPLFYFKDEEFVFYLLLTIIATVTITISLLGTSIETTDGRIVEGTVFNSIRYAAFQVASIFTTTGFCTANFDLWPTFSTFLLVCLMFIGGCGGSTGGGMKNSRVLLLLKYSTSQVKRCLFPHSISNIRLNKERMGAQTLHKVLSFFFLFIMLFVIFSLLTATLCNTDIVTAATASVACLGNIGPGLSKVGATCTYSWMTPSAKMLLTLAMLLGRLELYTVLVLILPSFWRK